MPLSFSQLQLYQRCPKQYEYAVVKKIPRSIRAGESFGSSVHNALGKWGGREMGKSGNGELGKSAQQMGMFQQSEQQPDLSFDALLKLWHSSFIVEGHESRLEADFARKRGEQLMRHFYEWWSREPRTVLAIEKGFSITVEGIECTGRFDRVEQCKDGVRVIDYKTGAVRTQDSVDSDLQLSMYAMAAQEMFGMPCTELILLFLNEEEFVECGTNRNRGQLQDASRHIRLLSDTIATNDFHPTPGVDVCRGCPYKGICPVAAAR